MEIIKAMYADGGIAGVQPSRIGGTWACCLVDGQEKRIKTDSGRVLPAPTDHAGRIVCPHLVSLLPNQVATPTVECNQSEFYAFLRGLMLLPDEWSGLVFTDSKNTIGRFFRGYAMKGIPEQWQLESRRQQYRLGVLHPLLLHGHPNMSQLAAGIGKRGKMVSEHNCWCDEECKRIAAEMQKEACRNAGSSQLAR